MVMGEHWARFQDQFMAQLRASIVDAGPVAAVRYRKREAAWK
jgi:hypothetical protein